MKKVEQKLVKLFLRNGCLRYPDEMRQEKDGVQKYKKGYEIRWTAMSEQELEDIQMCLEKAGFAFGKAYPKGNRTIIPVYGKESISRFQELLSQYQSV